MKFWSNICQITEKSGKSFSNYVLALVPLNSVALVPLNSVALVPLNWTELQKSADAKPRLEEILKTLQLLHPRIVARNCQK